MLESRALESKIETPTTNKIFRGLVLQYFETHPDKRRLNSQIEENFLIAAAVAAGDHSMINIINTRKKEKHQSRVRDR